MLLAINLGKSKNKISTGIGFFDHILDQFNSHTQIEVSVEVSRDNVNIFFSLDWSQIFNLLLVTNVVNIK